MCMWMSSSSILNANRPLRDLIADRIERRADRLAFGGRQQPDVREHAGMGLRSADIDRRQPRVETDRLGEFLDSRIGLPLESPPHAFATIEPRSHSGNEKIRCLPSYLKQRAFSPPVRAVIRRGAHSLN